MPESLINGKGRLVSRFGTLAFDGLDQRGLFSADVSAGADEDAEVKVQIGTEDVLA